MLKYLIGMPVAYTITYHLVRGVSKVSVRTVAVSPLNLTHPLSSVALATAAEPAAYYQEQEQQQPESSEPIEAELFSEQTSIQPGKSFGIALKISVDDGWHTYWKEPGDVGVACAIDWALPEGFEADELLWPTPTKYTEGDKSYWGYCDDFVLMTEITPPADLEHSTSPISLSGTLQWLACNDSNCLPGESSIKVDLPVLAATPDVNTTHRKLIAEARAQLTPKDWKARTVQTAVATRSRTLNQVNLWLPSRSTTRLPSRCYWRLSAVSS